ncbi:MAG: hypothetical protein FWH27_10140 [Planctomycetaceae bacterium]|nr:hypothetical protein [Planctomycetaceae bacterium]
MTHKPKNSLIFEQRIVAIFNNYSKIKNVDLFENFPSGIQSQIDNQVVQNDFCERKLILWFLNADEWTLLTNLRLVWHFEGHLFTINLSEIACASWVGLERMLEDQVSNIFIINFEQQIIKVRIGSGGALESMYNVIYRIPCFFNHDQELIAECESVLRNYLGNNIDIDGINIEA